jgi:hypothetical protein
MEIQEIWRRVCGKIRAPDEAICEDWAVVANSGRGWGNVAPDFSALCKLLRPELVSQAGSQWCD